MTAMNERGLAHARSLSHIERSYDQRIEALRFANGIRMERARLKRRLYDGETTVADVLRDLPACALTMKVSVLLGAQHRWGPTKVSRFMLQARISHSKTVIGLTDRQRAEATLMLNGGG